MKQQLEKRLQELRLEFESGKKNLAEIEEKEAGLKQTLLRISGAIQVLEEELAKCEEESSVPEVVEMKSVGQSGEEGSTEKVSVGN
jgi:chromosome segregation ATPase